MNALNKIAPLKVVQSLEPGLKFIGTHDGTFHADELTATSILLLLNKYKDHGIELSYVKRF